MSTRLALAELMLSGCTTASDHHYLFSAALTRAIDVQAEAAQELGARVVLTRGSMSLSADDGGLPPQSLTEPESTILADSERLIRRYHDPAPHAMCQIALAPCSPFSVTRELMRETARIARSHGVKLHTHLGETCDETEFCEGKVRDASPRLPRGSGLAGRRRSGWPTASTSRRRRSERLGTAGTGVCHCPSVQHGIGVGHLPGP